MIKYSDRAAVNWSGLDVEYHLCDVVDLKVKDEAGLNKYLHEVMDDVLEVYEDEIIEFINHHVWMYLEDHLVKIKKDINEFR